MSEKVLREVSESIQNLPPDERYASAHKALSQRKDELLDKTLTFPGFDPARHTPLELLHTFLLGVVRYLWHETTTNLSATGRETFAMRLRAQSHLSIVGPKASQSEYIRKYPNSLIGRHLKEIIQLGTFGLDDLSIDENLFHLWLDLGRLTTLVWFPRITEIDRYRENLRAAVANVLDGFLAVSPKEILRKIKLHILVHLEDDILAFVPLPGVSSERFESFNAVFRHSAIHSNRQHLSRDIAQDCAGQERLKQIMSGGYIPEEGVWRLPSGPIVTMTKGIHFLKNQFDLECHTDTPGDFAFSRDGHGRAPSFADIVTDVANRDNFPWLFRSSERARLLKYIVSKEKDRCFHSSWVIARRNRLMIGRISRLFCCGQSAYVVLDIFKFNKEKDTKLEMPVLVPTNRSILAEGDSLIFDFNVQKCRNQYLLNFHSLHHQDHLYRVIPKGLFDVSYRFEDRDELHRSMAERLSD